MESADHHREMLKKFTRSSPVRGQSMDRSPIGRSLDASLQEEVKDAEWPRGGASDDRFNEHSAKLHWRQRNMSMDSEDSFAQFDVTRRSTTSSMSSTASGKKGRAQPVLYAAAKHGETTTLIALISGGADVNGANASNGTTPLWIAARHGQAAAASILLAQGAAVDLARNDGVTPLAIAAVQRHGDMVSLLLAYGADADAADVDGATALAHAVMCVVANLQCFSTSTPLRSSALPFCFAGRRGSLNIVNQLIHSGASVNKADSSGASPLIRAVPRGQLVVIEALVGGGGNVNQADKKVGGLVERRDEEKRRVHA